MVKKPEQAKPQSGGGDPNTSPSGDSMVVGSAQPGRKLQMLPRRLWIPLAVIVIVVAGIVVWQVVHNPAPEPKTPLPSDVDNDYYNTELSNYPLLLNHDYGLTENDIMHGNLHKELKTFDEARNVAVAIARLGDRHRSLDAYKIAVAKAPKGTDESFYIEVMGVSYQMGDPKYGYLMYQKAATAVKNMQAPATDKQAELNHLQGLYELAKEGQDS